ncbi:response regulator [Hymenobacter weizhouensis]|uniref:response regulator n=1 Tax=Hymenobacter sp. YIM 151500-1 TaxID=2987689 RepID=UPI002225F331|nr:response regulator [Hymenobacter sp. YIM 151500-1]UYZ61418.1 response regulator [Hymenobacter sp. YIM 151500-1]
MQKLPCVLLVDDDPTTNFLNRKLLERLAVSDQIAVALNGREALDKLRAQCGQQPAGHPVLLFLDLNMPIMNGIQFLEAYRQLPPAQQCAVVVVMLTTSVHPQDVQRVGQLPVNDFLHKPLTQQQVERVLQQHFA